MVFNNILESIGKTPLIRLQSVVSHIPGTVYAKLESFNPGLNAKDRIALHMIEHAERLGQLQPGGTVVDTATGNTGFSLAMVCAIKGYKCVLAVSSKISEDKLNNLRAMGAEVILCPQDALPNDPRSYYRRAEQLAKEIPGAYYIGQSFNPDNADAHFLSTGPEIWEQTQGRISWLIGSVSAGGTLFGSGRFLREQNPDIKVVAVDTYGSVPKKHYDRGIYDENDIHSYRIEGMGKNTIPTNMDFKLIDRFVKVTDQDSALRAREIARKEGMLVGYSSGAALQCLEQIKGELEEDDVVVLIFADHGTKYVGKVFNDKWMQQQGMSPFEPRKNVAKGSSVMVGGDTPVSYSKKSIKNINISEDDRLNILGGSVQSMGYTSNEYELLKIARQGLSYEDFLKIMEFSGFSVKEWAIYVQLNERTLQRYKAENLPFEQIYSERILGIARLLQKGATLFGDMVVFGKWLSTENVALGKITPKQLLDSTFGISILEDELTKIEHGVFA